MTRADLQPDRQPGWRTGLVPALGGALLLAAASTVADLLWAAWHLRHRMVYGLIHGASLFVVFGLYLGLVGRSRRGLLIGLAGGPAAGLAAAASYYLLRPWLRAGALFAAWMVLWILLAIVARLVLGNRGPVRRALVRGAAAALSSGLAFYAISGIWLRPPPGGPNPAYFFACWVIAFLPGFVALLWREPETASSGR